MSIEIDENINFDRNINIDKNVNIDRNINIDKNNDIDKVIKCFVFPPPPPPPPSSWPWYFKFGVPKRNLINWWRNQPHTNRESEMHHKAQLYWWRAATLMRWCCWGADAANALMSLMPDALILLMQLMSWCADAAACSPDSADALVVLI